MQIVEEDYCNSVAQVGESRRRGELPGDLHYRHHIQTYEPALVQSNHNEVGRSIAAMIVCLYAHY